MATSSVVRIGPCEGNASANLLRTALVSHFQKLDESSTNAEAFDDKAGSTLTMSNKYFTAKVLMEDIGEAAVPQGKEDGVVLVFDALQSNPDRVVGDGSAGGATFDSLTLAHDEAESKNGAGDLLRLCVGVTLTATTPEEIRGKDAEKEYSRRILWCLDRGYEYVEADLSQEGQEKGHKERDKEGFARIVEAIQGTVWSSAVMSQSKTKELQKSYQEDTTKLDGDEKEEPENPYEPPDPSKFASLSTGTATSTTSAAEAEGTSIAEGLILDPSSVGPQELEAVRKDLEADQLFEKMEGVLREASRIREDSKSGTMTDDERRARAGDAAMALVNLMSQFGLDDDDDSQIVDSSDDDDSGIVEKASSS